MLKLIFLHSAALRNGDLETLKMCVREFGILPEPGLMTIVIPHWRSSSTSALQVVENIFQKFLSVCFYRFQKCSKL